MPFIGDNSRLDAADHLQTFFTNFVPASGPANYKPMNFLQFPDPADLDAIRGYLLTLRDAQVTLAGTRIATTATGSAAFQTKVSATVTGTEIVTIQIANARKAAVSSVVLTGPMTHFLVDSNTCTASPAIRGVAANGTDAGACQIGIKFSPQAGTSNDQTLTSLLQLTLTFANDQNPATAQYNISISGKSAGPLPAPAFSYLGLDALTFSALPASAKTLCPTIKNTGNANLTVNFSAPQLNGSSPQYFEIGNIASCPANPTPLPAVCTGAAAAVTGSATIIGGGSCTLPIKFNPAKFGEAGGTGSRNATLRITHNAAIVSPQDFTMSGNVETQAKIGILTAPGAVGDNVAPLQFVNQQVGTSSTAWSDFFVFNAGTADGLDITDVVHTNPQEFTLTENCKAALPLAKAVGSDPHCAITLTFKPTGELARCTTLTVSASVGSNAVVKICGRGVAAPPPPPVVGAHAVVTSPETKVLLDRTLDISGIGSTPANGITYQWAVRNPAQVTTQAGTAATQSVHFTAVGTYRVSLTVQPTAGGTTSSDFVDIEVAAPPVTAPGFSASGFDALTHFTATTASSHTQCPIIQNSGNAPLSLSFSALQAPGSSANYANYFELGDNASCPATPRACNTSLPAGSAISGSTQLQTSADGACTLAIRFNPAKLGDAGEIGTRSATLRIMHNAPASSIADYALTGTVTPRPLPSIGLSTDPAPNPLNGRVFPPAFASQPLTTTSAAWNELRVFNNGDADGLDITEVGNSNSQAFSLTENCISAPPLARLVGGTEAQCVIGLRFTPKTLGEHCTTIMVKAAVSGNGTQSMAICGTAVRVPGPAIIVSSDIIDFGRRFINGAYQPRELILKNGDGATGFLQINAVTLVGAGFTLVPDAGSTKTPCVGTTLAPGSSCTVRVQFTPDPARPETAYSGSVHVDSNDPTAPRTTVSLAGFAGTIATPPVLQFPSAPAQIEFPGIVVAGQQALQPLTVTMSNAGPGNASIEAIRMVGADASSFSASGCPAFLEQGASCVITVRFLPGSGGVKKAQLEILASRSISPSLLSVTGRGVGGSSAFLTASVASLALGSVRVGAQSAPLEVRLASAGDGVVTVTGLQAEAPFTVKTKTCPPLPFTLPRGSDCTVTVSFAPTDARSAGAVLRISTDADAKALEVPLTGSGEENANVSNGGCSMASGETLFDPTLWLLVLLAIGALLYRRRARGALPRS